MSVGFKWGPLSVVRLASDKRYGAWLEVGGEREVVEIRVTKGGRLRVGKIAKRLRPLDPTLRMEVID